MSPTESSPGVFLEEQGANGAREKSVRRVGFLKRLQDSLSLPCIYLVLCHVRLVVRLQKRLQKRDIKDSGYHHASHCYPTFMEYLELRKVGKALTIRL